MISKNKRHTFERRRSHIITVVKETRRGEM